MLRRNNTEGIELLVLIVVFLAFATIAVGLRIWARRIKRRSLGFNDYACFVAWVFTAGFVAEQIYAVVDGGVGQHLKTITHGQIFIILKVYKAGWLLWATGVTAVRLSILHLLCEIFVTVPFRRAAHIIMVVTAMWYLGVFITFFAICRPFDFDWRSDERGVCGNFFLSFLLSAIFNLCLDLCIIVLPMPMLWRLQMPMSRKISLMIIFGIGTVICVITMLRIDSVVKFASRAAHKDFSYTIFYDSLWSVLENTLGIINCTLPFMPPVIKNIADSKLWQSLSSQASRLNPRGYGSRSGNSSKRPKNTRHYDRDIETSFKPFPPAVKNMKPLGSHSGDMYPLTSLSTGSVSGVEHPFPELIQKSATG